VISHDRAQELISARMDAPLTAAEHRELNAHLATCDACRLFVASADDLARELHVMPRLAPSPAVSRAVMAAISAESTGWGWLRGALQTLSSPGMAVASGLALVVALAGAMFLAMNAPGAGDGTSADAEATIAALAVQPLPTQAPAETLVPEPTATEVPMRTISGPEATEPPVETPTPRPTETRVPIVARAEATETPVPAPVVVEQPAIQPVEGEDPTLAMAPEPEAAPVDTSTDLAQAAEPVQTGEEVTEAAPVPDEAIAALESAEESSNVSLPPAPMLPMPPDQAFLPITPTPVPESTPSPESEGQADAPQLAEIPSDDLGVTALAPEPPTSDVVVSEPDVTVTEDAQIREKERKDKSSRSGKSHENQQRAYDDGAMGWSMAPIDFEQAAQPQTTESAVATTTPAEPTDSATATTTPEPVRQIDPATGLEIDPATGLLIDPTTGYLLDLVNGLVYHPGTGFQVHPMTGLLIDPATGAQLDPVTLAVVIPAGFGTDSPNYTPGDPAMRGQIETTVDDTYDNATYKVIPPTDGPVQPVDEIIVPTESGDAIEVE